MPVEKARLKSIFVSMLKYYGVVACTFAIALPLSTVGVFIATSVESVLIAPTGANVLSDLLIYGICIIGLLPIMVLGIVGNFFLLFHKWKKRPAYQPPPAYAYPGQGHPYTYRGYHDTGFSWYGQGARGWQYDYYAPPPPTGWYNYHSTVYGGHQEHQPPPPPPPDHYVDWDDEGEHRPHRVGETENPDAGRKKAAGDEAKEEVRPFELPPIVFSIILLGSLIAVSIFAYVMIAVGLALGTAAMVLIMLVGAAVFIAVFPFLFTYPPFLWIEVLQKGKSRIVEERTVLKGLAWGMLSPAPVIFIGLTLSVVYMALSGSEMPMWLDTPVITPLVEEFCKAFGLVFLFSRLRNQYDGLIVGFCCGVGFSVVENLLYFSGTAAEGLGLSAGEGIISWTFVVVVRSLMSTMSHGLGSGLVGFGLGYLSKGLKEGKTFWFLPVAGYFLAVVLHAAWNGTIVFLETGVPEDLQNTLLVNAGMFLFIISFFFLELSILLGLKHLGKSAENKEVLFDDEKGRERGGRRPGPRRRPGPGTTV